MISLPGLEVGRVDVQPLHAVQQGAPGQAEFAGGAGLVALVALQALDQQVAFDPLQAVAQTHCGRGVAVIRQIEVFGQQQVAFTQQQGAGDHALELAHVARKAIVAELLQCAAGPLAGITVEEAAGLLGEATGQQLDIVSAFTQGRQVDGEGRQTVVQVFTEAPLADHFRQILVGGGNDPHVHLARFVAAQRAHFAFLQYPQQLGLQRQGHVTDLVEEQGAAMGIVDQAAVIPVGAGEGALAIAEQFTFQQMLRQRRAVLHHKALAAPRSVVMDGPGHQLLAGAGLAGDHHRHRVVQYLADELIDLLHGRAFADQTVTAAQRRCWFRRAGGRFRPGLLQQLQLMQREIAQQVQRVPIDLQLRRFPGGQQQQAADVLLVILQRQAQQAAPVARIGRQEVGGIEMVVELLDV